MDPNNEILRTVCVALGRSVIILETIWHHTLSLKGLKIIEKLTKILSSLFVFCLFLYIFKWAISAPMCAPRCEKQTVIVYSKQILNTAVKLNRLPIAVIGFNSKSIAFQRTERLLKTQIGTSKRKLYARTIIYIQPRLKFIEIHSAKLYMSVSVERLSKLAAVRYWLEKLATVISSEIIEKYGVLLQVNDRGY